MSHSQKALFIIFGGTGDLAYRKLYPALYKLYTNNFLSDHFAVIGTARREWTDEYYQEIILDSIDSIKKDDKDAKKFASHFRYQSHNVKDTDNYHTLRERIEELDTEYKINGNRIFYLSMSPTLFGTITSHLKDQKLVSDNGFNRVIIEKPFGTNFRDSNLLNNHILKSFDEEQIYRIDHYLGKDMIQTILPLKFGNPAFSHLWNKEHISNMQVTLAEDIGVEERGGYYDNSGALRDMVQNHILQIVSLLYMEEPTSNNADNIALKKVEALKNLKPITKDNIDDSFVRGQYTHTDTDANILDYLSEENVKDASTTETFVAGKIESTAAIWEGVPIYIRTGKRMKAKETRIDIVFKDKTSSLYQNEELNKNILTIHIGPEQGVSLKLNNKVIGYNFDLVSSTLTYDVSGNIPDDYEKLILNALQGNKSSFVYWEEVAYSWKYIDAIRQLWDETDSPLYLYPADTNGPKEASALLGEQGHCWVWS